MLRPKRRQKSTILARTQLFELVRPTVLVQSMPTYCSLDSIVGRTETHRLDSHVKIQKSLARPQLHVAVSSPDFKAPQTALADDRLLGETASGAHSFSGCRLHLFYPGRCGGHGGSRARPSYHLPPSVQPHLPEQSFWMMPPPAACRSQLLCKHLQELQPTRWPGSCFHLRLRRPQPSMGLNVRPATLSPNGP